jgi:flagellar biosynthesis/type III secretory pathway chaperone
MVSKELLELKKVLEEEKSALINGAIEEILKWASYKARLVDYLKNKELTPEEEELLKEIVAINERNRRIIEAGLSFVQEAYEFLTQLAYQKDTYGKNGTVFQPMILSKAI